MVMEYKHVKNLLKRERDLQIKKEKMEEKGDCTCRVRELCSSA
jgi:hypothetical protein